MCQALKEVMEQETRYKQFKRYFVKFCGMEDSVAQHNADKYNEGCRVYNKFPVIVDNCTKCINIDIRDFTIHELALAVRLSWVMRRSASNQTNVKGYTIEDPVLIDQGSVEQCVEDILRSEWYLSAKRKPALVANIMNKISDRVLSNSLYYNAKN